MPTEITVSQLARLIGTPETPVVIDIRIDEDFAVDPRLIPGSSRRAFSTCQEWAPAYAGKRVAVSCQKGLKLSQGVAALLRHAGADAVSLEGGFEAWIAANQFLLRGGDALRRDAQGHSLWVTRARPKIDRIACPWLIRRFVDPGAVFLYVAASEVEAVADRFGAMPFDIDGVFWSHRGPVGSAEHTCSFDTMLAEFGLSSPALDRLAVIVRAADTARLDLAPQAAGFLAASLGLSRMFSDDLAQLDAAMLLYDAMYRWCRDGTEETHNWPNPGRKA
ncbi:MAG: sulfurtransferase/chromate resistance protein [Beijerinckiaceae bacterium]|nr:sulfurtransferase/chromate resistance protein [Beijerinckiaceae bacterium]